MAMQGDDSTATEAAVANGDIGLVLTPPGWHDYRLLDSGDGQKLEQVGPYRFIRPEAQALWRPALAATDWQEVAGRFVTTADAGNGTGPNRPDEERGRWSLDPGLPEHWRVAYDALAFQAMPTPFRHLGFFPEQAAHWCWCERLIRRRAASGSRPRILNLFAYTGIASLHAARAGAEVTHVDASRKAIAQAFENRSCAGMDDAPIRFITDDARDFVLRELRRGRRYDGIILDPPKYGRGPKGGVWRLEQDLAPLLGSLADLLSSAPLFVVLTAYAIRASSLSLHYTLAESLAGRTGRTESGELAVAETGPAGRLISQAIFARWQGQQDS